LFHFIRNVWFIKRVCQVDQCLTDSIQQRTILSLIIIQSRNSVKRKLGVRAVGGKEAKNKKEREKGEEDTVETWGGRKGGREGLRDEKRKEREEEKEKEIEEREEAARLSRQTGKKEEIRRFRHEKKSGER